MNVKQRSQCFRKECAFFLYGQAKEKEVDIKYFCSHIKHHRIITKRVAEEKIVTDARKERQSQCEIFVNKCDQRPKQET